MSRDRATALQPGQRERNFVGVGGRNAKFGSENSTPGQEGACCELSSPREIHAVSGSVGFTDLRFPVTGIATVRWWVLESTRKRYGLDFHRR